MLEQYLIDIKVNWEIIILTEINIKKDEIDQYNINGYEKKTITRENTKRGGGIMVFIKEVFEIDYKELDFDENNVMEINIKKKNVDEKEIQIISVYRKPDSDKNEFVKKLKNLIKNNKGTWKQQIILGDINIDILENQNDLVDKHEQKSIDNYENTLAKLGYEKKIDSPTREEIVRKNGKNYLQQSCIDHIYIKNSIGEARGGTLTEKISDHYFTMCWIWKFGNKDNTSDKIEAVDEECWQYNTAKIIKEMNQINWEYINKMTCPDGIYAEITKQINKVYSKNKMKRNKRCSRNGENKRREWITKELVLQIENKNRLWNRIRKKENIDEELIKKYNYEKKDINRKIKECKQKFFTDRLESLQQNKKPIWDVVNEVTNKRKKANIDENIMTTFKGKDLLEIANEFNNTFTNQIPKLKGKYKEEHENYKKGKFSKSLGKSKSTKLREIRKSMYIDYADENKIIDIIKELKNTKATGIDKIQTEHIKQTKENTAKVVCKLINAMIDKEIWPEMLKIQIIRPVYKKGNKIDTNNYRPIALLSIIDKIIEKFFADKIRNFLEKQQILSKVQFGYTKNKSTTDLLIKINEVIATALNEGKYVGVVLIDLQKAFDTFDQKILLKKCANMGLRGKIYNLIKSYLNNRKTMVQIKENNSNLNNANYGVPQGSVLGPLLYLIYTNDITDNLTKTMTYLFADDTIMISINYKYEEMMRNLQNDFNLLNDWFIENELFISKEKTVQMDITVPKMNKREDIWIIKHYGDCVNLQTLNKNTKCHGNCTKLEKKIHQNI
jgi:hypothetical protein